MEGFFFRPAARLTNRPPVQHSIPSDPLDLVLRGGCAITVLTQMFIGSHISLTKLTYV